MVKILAFDTSTELCSVALSCDDKIITLQKNAPKQHNELILPMIDELLQKAHLKLAQLDAIAFGCGPGSFTGIRLAASVAQGLAYGVNLPIIPVSTLQILAQTAYDQFSYSHALVVLDARMEQVYWGAYKIIDGLMEEVLADAIAVPSQISFSQDGNWVGVGNGWKTYQAELQKTCCVTAIKDEVLPEARSIIKLAITSFSQHKTVAPQFALPVYLGGGKTWKE